MKHMFDSYSSESAVAKNMLQSISPMRQSYEAVIGLECHAQLLTNSKLFCSCSTKFGEAPNMLAGRDHLRSRFDTAEIQLIDFLDVFDDTAELLRQRCFFLTGDFKHCQLRDVLDIL